MAGLQDLVRYCDQRLEADAFDDYCPNGLQVESGTEINKLILGVTASMALIEAAIEHGADGLLVHHGYFWKNEAPVITGMKGRRIRKLLENGVSLLAYHLPLDAHPELGNNVQLASRLAFPGPGAVDSTGLVWGSELENPLPANELSQRIATALERQPLLIEGGREPIGRVAWCTGGAQSYIEQAADLGYDAFISGEVSESTVHVAREREIHYFAAGHHATERYGVQALGQELATRFGIEQQFVDIDNPV